MGFSVLKLMQQWLRLRKHTILSVDNMVSLQYPMDRKVEHNLLKTYLSLCAGSRTWSVSRTHLLEKLQDVNLASAFTAEASVDSWNCSHGYGFGSGGQVSSLAQVLGRADTSSKSSLCRLLFQE